VKTTLITRAKLFLLALALLLACGQAAFAAPAHSLSIDCSSTPLKDSTFILVKIADVQVYDTPPSTRYTTLPQYQNAYWGTLDGEELHSKALELRDEITLPDDQYQEMTTTNSIAAFSGIDPALYLVIRKVLDPKQEEYLIDPFLVSVPYIDENDENDVPIYNVTAKPKYDDNPDYELPDPGDDDDDDDSSSTPSSDPGDDDDDDDYYGDDDDDDDDPPSRTPSTPPSSSAPSSQPPPGPVIIPEDPIPLEPFRCTNCNCRFPEWINPCTDCGAENTVIFDDPSALANLPATGQLNWPVPVLISAGIVLFLIGFDLRRERRGKTD
jgi:hypothetical protein